MRKDIDLGGSTLTLECNAATPFVVKRLGGFDMLRFLQEIDGSSLSADNLEKIETIIFCMHLQGIKSTREVLNETLDDFPEWLAGYSFDEMTTVIMPEGIGLWADSKDTTSTSKNQADPQ